MKKNNFFKIISCLLTCACFSIKKKIKINAHKILQKYVIYRNLHYASHSKQYKNFNYIQIKPYNEWFKVVSSAIQAARLSEHIVHASILPSTPDLAPVSE